jgi:hypothetical protein
MLQLLMLWVGRRHHLILLIMFLVLVSASVWRRRTLCLIWYDSLWLWRGELRVRLTEMTG